MRQHPRNRAGIAVLALSAAVLTGCGTEGTRSRVVVTTLPGGASSGASVDPGSASASSSASPSTSAAVDPSQAPTLAPAGGTRDPRVVGTAATGLAAPWGLAFLPDGRALVTERDTQRVLLVDAGTQDVREIATLDAAAPQGEAGLLGIALSPRFAQDRRVFLYVSTSSDNRVVRTTLEGRLDGRDVPRLAPLEPILTGIPNGFIHDGGRLLFGPDGYLYVSTGETGEPERAQDRDDLAGKILRITQDGDPAPGNPFGTAVWSWGHRNVQGLAFVGDQLWASEFGQDTYDELNRIERGANYGWPVHEGRGGEGEGYVDPQITWNTDDASPSGLAWDGRHLWLAALKGERLWRVDVAGGRASRPTGYLVGDYGRLRTVALAPDGLLWVTTSNRDGRGSPVAGDDRILLVRP